MVFSVLIFLSIISVSVATYTEYVSNTYHHFFVSPVVLFSVPFVFQYIIYPLVELWRGGYHQLKVPMMYGIIFYVILFVSYKLLPSIKFQISRVVEHEKEVISFALAACLFLIGYTYDISTGDFFGLYRSIEDISGGGVWRILDIIVSFKWYALGASLSIIIYRDKHSKYAGFVFWLVVMALLFRAFASTSKGIIMYVAIIVAHYRALTKGRIGILFTSVAILFAMFFFMYSVVTRDFGIVRGAFNLRILFNNIDVALSNMTIGLYDFIINFAERVNQTEALGIMMSDEWATSEYPINSKYAAGSLVDVANVVPSFIWPEKPHLSFNHYVTHKVWGINVFKEMPIGRIGESFLVLRYFGLIYAVFYGLIFKNIFVWFKKMEHSPFCYGCFFMVSFLWITPDAYITYNFNRLFYNSFFLGILYMLLLKR